MCLGDTCGLSSAEDSFLGGIDIASNPLQRCVEILSSQTCGQYLVHFSTEAAVIRTKRGKASPRLELFLSKSKRS